VTTGTPGRPGPVLVDVPVEPDAATARRWAENELLDPVYHERPSLLERFLEWLLDLFSRLDGGAVDPGVAGLVTTLVVVATVIAALVVAGPVRRARAGARSSTAVFDADVRTATQLRADADAHAAAGDWSAAVVERFRAIVRSLEERAVLDERPGRTAHEATVTAGERLPSVAADLRRAGDLFDDVRYGDRGATAEDDARLRDLDQRVTQERPTTGPDAQRPEGVPVA
jgi:hypothetical protein